MKWLKLLLILIAILASILILKQLVFPFFTNNNSLLQVETPNVKTSVFLDNKNVGETPFLGENIREGEYNLLLEAQIDAPSTTKVQFSKKITLITQTLTAVNYDFGPSEKFSSGDIRTLRVGEGLSIVTNPQGAQVKLNGQKVGESPLSLSPNSGINKIKISSPGYYSRELEINVEPGHRLVIEVFLAINPFEKVEKIQDGRVVVYDLSTKRDGLLSDLGNWANAAFFYERVQKLSFDSLFDLNGNQYFKDKDAWDEKLKKGKKVVVGYLGDTRDKGLTSEAKGVLATFTKIQKPKKKATPIKQIEVLQTPTGTLNVRKGPSTSYPIITKIKPGEKYELLGEQSDWYKIKVGSKEGWISGQYAKKL